MVIYEYPALLNPSHMEIYYLMPDYQSKKIYHVIKKAQNIF